MKVFKYIKKNHTNRFLIQIYYGLLIFFDVSCNNIFLYVLLHIFICTMYFVRKLC